MRVLITGANGFVGKNLAAHLAERNDVEVITFTRENSIEGLPGILGSIDFVFHLAGVNRPENPEDFKSGNANLTKALCDAIRRTGRSIPLLYTSSTQAELQNKYGLSKRDAENYIRELSLDTGSPVYIFRLPNVFGKWSRPSYNSAVATFCYNIARDIPIQINDPTAQITLVYIDDVVKKFLEILDAPASREHETRIEPQYKITVGDLADQIHAFRDSRKSLVTERVGVGLVRALYSTYLSFLPEDRFSYELPMHGDARGVFVEMLKTPDSGQFSFFTAHPGVTRGGHYHHSKTEKFLVIKGSARFKFRNISTGAFYELYTSGEKAEVVETVPGWTHDITNVGSEEMVVMLWANEIFDREHPDTYACPVGEK
ncbi:TPA: NAD-dependent epimerase/dehydratase family protein [Pseudomonas aeruginosa]|uniref:UDP-2-acetamido-2,6-beta-L-arabino-hexul-4-ose reductase n=1 Tax=Pseudomonas aeruginosa TaxID=287 RepID=UPI0012DAB2ED|nr:NAD-dependent epimerase/dehydratase family protein [Pseudomonas aeruginosa]MDG4279481.1 NAD-dependent epimerase/dehydratase family protein [Pseudomonas aeruginosa]MUI17309.1 NAD-dependent epimerase/dehydratase family protein [Pseudomonas aeruginosa]MUT35545.1 NAD-dependent epimerase/dehydratase family protein [Pseudomonas aeruginosa]HBO3907669.1 NAD-dependent epimerase/dehydratase family protein [Pseudomonas aeruginosa]HCF7261594.1 NAD-dependent epimerase/dehydratase family protein [Pseudom